MLKASMRSARLPPAGPKFDICIIVPISVCAYVIIISPMLIYLFPGESVLSPRVENKIFWPAVTAISLACLALRKRSRLTLPPHIKWLAAYLALAGASVLWAFNLDMSLNRFVTQLMIVTSIVLPGMLAIRTADMIPGVFLCYLVASVINALLILGGYSTESLADNLKIGYPGYFSFKGTLGECAAVAILLSFYEISHPGWRRALGVVLAVISVYLIVVSQSKGSLGIALIAPLLAGIALFIGRKMRVSPAIVLLPIPIGYAVLSSVVGDIINRISWHIYSNYTLSGRTVIWDWVNLEIAQRPLLGWGFQSFWLIGGNDSPIPDSAGWVKRMPSAHNGYLDRIVDTGYIGLALFLIFIFTTIHATGRVANRDPTRAWLLLSIALFVIIVNFLESGWLHGFDVLWVPFVIVVAEAGRYWQPVHRGPASRPVPRGPIIAPRRPPLARVGVSRMGYAQHVRMTEG
jgi:exopolysaccharide production protein ExoQ